MPKRPRTSLAPKGSQVRTQPEPKPGHLEDCWDEPPPGPSQRSDTERLQGAWVGHTGRRPVAFLVCGKQYTIHFAGGDIYMGSFELDLAGRPRAMVVCIHEGPDRHKGQTALCFYELDGDTMRWCTGGPGRTDRPPAFPTADDPNFLCLVFRREQRIESPRG